MTNATAILNIVGICGFLLFSAMLMRARQFRILAINLFIGQVWSMLSCFYLTTGQYNVELGYTTWQNLSPLSLAFYNGLFFAAAWLLLRRETPLVEEGANSATFGGWTDGIVLIVIGAAVTYLTVTVIVNGPPLFSGEARQRFLQRAMQTNAPTRVAAGSTGFMALVLGVMVVHSLHARHGVARVMRFAASGFALLLVAEQVLAGEKFSGIFWVAFFFALPYLLFVRTRPRAFGRIALVAALIGGVYGMTKLARAYFTEDAQVSMATRVLALQGELYWVVHDRAFQDFKPNTAQLAREFVGGEDRPGERVGIWYLMERYGDPVVVFSSIIAGFTGGYPAMALELFGPYWTVPIQILMGLIFGGIGLLVLRYVRRRQYIRLYLAGTLFVLANSVFVMGTLSDLFKPSSVAKLALLAVIELLLAMATRASQLSSSRTNVVGFADARTSVA